MATITAPDLKVCNAPTAEPLPPTALPADVYLEKLEKLLRENADLRAALGECLGLCRSVEGMVDGECDIGGDWCEAAVAPLKARLMKTLGM
jgi:hypothetical protein